MLKNSIVFLAFISFITIYTQAQKPIDKGLNSISQNSLKAQLSFFSSDWFEGREAAMKGAFMASDYLASIYEEYNLTPVINNSFFDDVPLVIAHQPEKATIHLIKKGSSNSFEFPFDLRAENIPQSYTIEAPIMWGGYGLNTNEIKEVNTKKSSGKILIRLKGLPEPKDENAPLALMLKNKQPNEWLQIKQMTINSSNAIAILEYDLNDPHLERSYITETVPSAEKNLNKRSSGIYNKSLFLPSDKKNTPHYFQVSQKLMRELIPNFDIVLERYLDNLSQKDIKSITTFNYSSIKLSAKANVEHKKCRNVLAMIKGSDYPDEIIVVGAHYDHLGSYDGYIWNGADDNGSGTIGVVAIAKAFVASGIQPKRTIIFANWTAEERGLLGSRSFVNSFNDIGKIKYYHNYDMIGRSFNYEQPDSAVTLLYTKTWKQAEELCALNNKKYNLGLKINYSAWDNPTSGSDNTPFAKKGIPIMWFHTGGHESYHMPDDHVEKIDWQKYEAIVKTSFLTLWNLANE